jgi:hypothetical protein
MSIPSAASLFEMSRVEEGLELDVSIRALPEESPSLSPLSPKMTSSTTSEFGSDRRTTSDSVARSSGDAADSAGASPSFARASGSAS